MSETDERESTNPARNPAKPLPRLWKAEPEPEEADADPGSKPSAKKSKKTGDAPATAKAAGGSKAAAGKSKKSAKGKSEPDEKGEKRVLKEETPTLDTYESRRRVRLMVGGLTGACALPARLDLLPRILLRPQSDGSNHRGFSHRGDEPRIRPPLDLEARFMYNRASELAKNGRTDLAMAKLADIVKAYKGTATAADAKAALERRRQEAAVVQQRADRRSPGTTRTASACGGSRPRRRRDPGSTAGDGRQCRARAAGESG